MSQVKLSSLIAPNFWNVHADIKKRGHGEYWLKGGRGSLKSSFISIEIILGMMRNPMASALIYRRVKATLRESVYEQMIWAIDRLGVRDYWVLQLSPLEIRHRITGQRILFRGADDPGKSKSIKLSKGYFGYLWFEETAEFQNMEALRTIKASAIRGEGEAITFYSYNPPVTARNWTNEEAVREKPGRMQHESNYLQAPRNWIGEAFIAEAEALKPSNPRAYRHMYLGEVTGTGANVFENLKVRKITDAEIGTFGATYCGMDFGWFPDPTHFVRVCYEPGTGRIWIYDEYVTVKTANREIYAQLIHKHGLTADEEVIADSQEQKSISDFKSFGMRCIGATKGPGSVRTGLKWLQAQREIIVDPVRCPATAREFMEYEYEKDREGNPVDVYPDKNNHGIDAVRYALNRIWLKRGS